MLVNFSGDSLTAEVNIEIIDDEILEYPEIFGLELRIPQAYADLGILVGEQNNVNVTIIDNDGKLHTIYRFYIYGYT